MSSFFRKKKKAQGPHPADAGVEVSQPPVITATAVLAAEEDSQFPIAVTNWQRAKIGMTSKHKMAFLTLVCEWTWGCGGGQSEFAGL